MGVSNQLLIGSKAHCMRWNPYPTLLKWIETLSKVGFCYRPWRNPTIIFCYGNITIKQLHFAYYNTKGQHISHPH